MRFWVSWYEPFDVDAPGDYRPRQWPLPPEIPAYWCSGETRDAHTLCAVVDVRSEAEVVPLLLLFWTVSDVRFLEERSPDWRPGKRFPWPAT